MALIVLTSASGSPGVTTTALGLALAWPRPVLLVEADPTGASAVFAGYFRGGHEPTGGLINLAVAHREGRLATALPREMLILDQSKGPENAAWFLPGPQSHEQAASLLTLWEPLTELLRRIDTNGQDVIVDAGRLGLTGWPEPLVLAADLALLVTRNNLAALAGARSWAKTLHDRFADFGGLARLHLLTIDQAGGVPGARTYRARQVTGALGLPVWASVGWDPTTAAVYSHGASPRRTFETSPLLHDYRAIAGVTMTALTVASRAELTNTTATAGSLP
jgi:hypothetical protein